MIERFCLLTAFSFALSWPHIQTCNKNEKNVNHNPFQLKCYNCFTFYGHFCDTVEYLTNSVTFKRCC